jgi:hypothetical protein
LANAWSTRYVCSDLCSFGFSASVNPQNNESLPVSKTRLKVRKISPLIV